MDILMKKINQALNKVSVVTGFDMVMESSLKQCGHSVVGSLNLGHNCGLYLLVGKGMYLEKSKWDNEHLQRNFSIWQNL